MSKDMSLYKAIDQFLFEEYFSKFDKNDLKKIAEAQKELEETYEKLRAGSSKPMRFRDDS